MKLSYSEDLDLSYKGLNYVIVEDRPHLGGNVKHGDPYTFAPTVVDYLIKRFSLRSMLDLGSGQGHAASLFHRLGVIALACDGLLENVQSAVHPTVLCDFTKSSFRCSVDLVWCQEVAEHVEEAYVGNFVESLASGKFIIMTHALPGQSGYHHVNLKPAEYWIDKMSEVGFNYDEEDTNRIRALAGVDKARYLQKSGLVFVRR